MIKKKSPIIAIIALIIVTFLYLDDYNSQTKVIDDLESLNQKTVGKVINYEYDVKVGGGRYGHTYRYHKITIEYEIDGKKYISTNKYIGPINYTGNIKEQIDIQYNSCDNERIMPTYILEYQIKRKKLDKKIIIICMIMWDLIIVIGYYKNQYKIQYWKKA